MFIIHFSSSKNTFGGVKTPNNRVKIYKLLVIPLIFLLLNGKRNMKSQKLEFYYYVFICNIKN